MEDRVRTMSCNLSNRYLNPGFKELRSTIADHQAPSWGQMYFLVELCKKTIEELEKNPPDDFSQVCERSSQWCELRYSQVQTAH